MKIKVADNLEQLEAYAEAWDDLVQQTPHALPMQSHAWLSCYFRHRLRSGEQWRCVFLFDGQQMVGVMPLISVGRTGLVGRSKLLRLPDDEKTTTTVDLVLASGREQEVQQCLADFLQQLDGGWREFDMPRVPENSASLASLPALSGKLRCLSEPRSVGSYLPTVDDFAPYRASLAPKFRSNLRNAANRLARFDDVEYEFLSHELASPQHLECFLAIEAASWKGSGGTAIISDAGHCAFYRSLTEALWRRGWLEWHFLKAEGRTIAAHLAIRCGTSLVIWKVGYDADYSRCSPSTLLFERTLARAFEDPSCHELNAITHIPWDDNWNVLLRPYYHVLWYPNNALALLTGWAPWWLHYRLREVPALRSAVRSSRQRISQLRKRLGAHMRQRLPGRG